MLALWLDCTNRKRTNSVERLIRDRDQICLRIINLHCTSEINSVGSMAQLASASGCYLNPLNRVGNREVQSSSLCSTECFCDHFVHFFAPLGLP